MFILGLIIGSISGVVIMALIIGGKMGNFIYYEKIEDYEKQFKKVKERDLYKSIIDEIREYIEKDYSFAKRHDIPLLTKDEQLAGELFEILDKAKELEEGNND